MPMVQQPRWWLVTSTCNIGYSCCVLAESVFTGEMFSRTFNGTIWLDWQRFATAEPPQIFDLPLAPGYATKDVLSIYGKTQTGIVHVSFKVVKPEGISTGQFQIAFLPQGYYPVGTSGLHGVCSHANFNGRFFPFFVLADGAITVVVTADIPAEERCGFAGSISFIGK